MAVTVKKSTTSSSANHRKSARFGCAVPIESKEGGIFDETATIDFSKGGIGFISRKSVPLNKKIIIELNLSPDDEPFLVAGRVKWVHYQESSETYRIGLAFEEILKGSRSRLNQYFANRLC